MKYEEKLRIVPVWEKAMLTVDEAVAYSGIGRDKLGVEVDASRIK